MKRICKYVLIMLFSVVLTACVNNNTEKRSELAATDNKSIKIVATIFPQYDWTKAILGDNPANAQLTLLLDKGVDLHSFQPTAEDILKISECDMFIYVGGESDEWVNDAIKEAVNKDMEIINLVDCLGSGAKTEEIKEGMEIDNDDEHHDDEHHDDEHHDDNDHDEYDEHVWLSLRNAKIFCGEIADKLCRIDPKNAAIYKANLEEYIKELDSLDAEFSELAKTSENRTLIFGDRFPFRYFTEDYGFDYYAAFVGCSAETEASFETIAFLSGKVDELNANTIFTIDGSDGKIAEAIIDNSKNKSANTAVLNSMQSVTGKQADEGTTYISIMKENYDILNKSLKNT